MFVRGWLPPEKLCPRFFVCVWVLGGGCFIYLFVAFWQRQLFTKIKINIRNILVPDTKFTGLPSNSLNPKFSFFEWKTNVHLEENVFISFPSLLPLEFCLLLFFFFLFWNLVLADIVEARGSRYTCSSNMLHRLTMARVRPSGRNATIKKREKKSF